MVLGFVFFGMLVALVLSVMINVYLSKDNKQLRKENFGLRDEIKFSKKYYKKQTFTRKKYKDAIHKASDYIDKTKDVSADHILDTLGDNFK